MRFQRLGEVERNAPCASGHARISERSFAGRIVLARDRLLRRNSAFGLRSRDRHFFVRLGNKRLAGRGGARVSKTCRCSRRPRPRAHTSTPGLTSDFDSAAFRPLQQIARGGPGRGSAAGRLRATRPAPREGTGPTAPPAPIDREASTAGRVVLKATERWGQDGAASSRKDVATRESQ
jgi:hypothetical protein